MLYEFYSTQTSRNPGSIRATYLLNGILKASKAPYTNGRPQDGDDMHMQSSPYMSSLVPHQEEAVSSRSIVLAREEDLEGKMTMQIYFTAPECAPLT